MEKAVQLKEPGPMTLTSKTKGIYSVLIFLGVLGFSFLLMQDKERAWHAYLIGFFFTLSLALGGLFFTAIQHITKAGWSVNIRRFSEAFTAFLPIAFGLGVLLALFGSHSLYSWLDQAIVAKDALIAHKTPYLNEPFFWIRLVLFFGIWIFFAKVLVGFSLKQDESGDEMLTQKSVSWGIACILLFSLSYSLFSVDFLMSLEPHWFSTIFGVYCFAGLFQSTIAMMTLFIIHFMKNGQLDGYVDDNHLHDLGKFLFAFTVFWAYIAFSQYMLIWYANLPEETIFFIPRVSHGWIYVSLSLILLKFILPFFALLPRWAKRNPTHLTAVSILILIMQFVDLYWLVYPNLNHDLVLFGIGEVFVFLGFLGLFLFSVTRFLSQNSIVPIKDPRIHESLNHHVVY